MTVLPPSSPSEQERGVSDEQSLRELPLPPVYHKVQQFSSLWLACQAIFRSNLSDQMDRGESYTIFVAMLGF